MSGLFGGAKTNAAQQPTYSGINVQTSVYGAVVPVVYGANRVAGNLIWYGDFTQLSGSGSKGGGKGGLGGGSGKAGGNTSQNTYQAAVIVALGEGPISGLGNAWSDKTETTPNAIGFGWLTGTYPQSPWTYITSNHPGQALGYPGIVEAVNPAIQLGSSAQLPNFTFEVRGRLYATAPNGVDADPSQVAVDILTQPAYGAGFPPSRVGTLSAQAEVHAIPGSGPYTVTVNLASAFAFNLAVQDGNGNLYTAVAANPGLGQYACAAGVYTFNAGNAGTAVTIGYAALGGLSTWQAYCLASGLWISPVYSSQQQTSSILDDLATYTNSEWVWSSGVLTMVPRGAVAVTANGYSYVPPAAPLFDLSDDDFLPNTNASGASSAANDDPVLLTRLRMSDQINDIKLEAGDRTNQYNNAVVEVTDQAMIDRYGRRANQSQQAHLFADLNAANTAAQLQLQLQYIRNTYQFTLDQRYSVLDPMDVVTLTDAVLGLEQQPVRITEITENDDGSLSVAAEEYPAGLGTAASYSFGTGSAGYRASYNADPGNANAPIIFEPPVEMPAGLEVWMMISGGSLWGGAQVWISFDGNSYTLAGSINGAAAMGVLTAPLPSGPAVDPTDVLAVDLTESGGTLLSFTQTDAQALNSLCYVDGELIAYATAQLTAASMYSLTYLVRGAYGTAIGAHAAGASFGFLDAGTIFKLSYTKDRIGQIFYVKLLSYNIWGGGLQSLDNVSPTAYTIKGPAPPGVVQNLAAQQNGDTVLISWSDLTDFALKGYDILYGPQGGTVAGAVLITEASRATSESTVSIPPGSWTIYVCGHDVADQVGPAAAVNLTVVSANLPVVSQSYGPDWLGVRSGFVLHHTAVLLPDSTKLANQLSNTQLFAQFCPSPVASPTYTAPVTDTGFTDDLRVFFGATAALGPGIVGSAAVSFALDYWPDGRSDPGSFTAWTVGNVSARYLRAQLTENTAAPAVLSQFTLTAEVAANVVETVQGFAVGSDGTTLAYASAGVGPFHSPPAIVVTPTDGTSTSGGASAITNASALIQLFRGSTAVSGTCNLLISGT